MKIKNLEESGIVKSAIICNDIILLMASYWLAFALTHTGFQLSIRPENRTAHRRTDHFPYFLHSPTRIPETHGVRQ